jgi:hypothetical protein
MMLTRLCNLPFSTLIADSLHSFIVLFPFGKSRTSIVSPVGRY